MSVEDVLEDDEVEYLAVYKQVTKHCQPRAKHSTKLKQPRIKLRVEQRVKTQRRVDKRRADW